MTDGASWYIAVYAYCEARNVLRAKVSVEASERYAMGRNSNFYSVYVALSFRSGWAGAYLGNVSFVIVGSIA